MADAVRTGAPGAAGSTGFHLRTAGSARSAHWGEQRAFRSRHVPVPQEPVLGRSPRACRDVSRKETAHGSPCSDEFLLPAYRGQGISCVPVPHRHCLTFSRLFTTLPYPALSPIWEVLHFYFLCIVYSVPARGLLAHGTRRGPCRLDWQVMPGSGAGRFLPGPLHPSWTGRRASQGECSRTAGGRRRNGQPLRASRKGFLWHQERTATPS